MEFESPRSTPPFTFRRSALIAGAIALVIVFILWNVPQLSILLFPFRMFVTFVHEAGHGLAAVLTGGSFISFQINPDGSGVAYTAGGARALVIAAGYLGSAFVGALIFYLAHTLPYPRVISVALGIFVGVVAVVFGGLLSMTTIVGAVMAFALIALGLRGGGDINLLALNVLSVLTALNAVLDVTLLINNSDIRAGDLRNDAAAFSREIMPLVPASVVAVVWSTLAVAMLLFAVYASLIRPLRRYIQNRRTGV